MLAWLVLVVKIFHRARNRNENMPFLYAGCGLLSHLIFPTAIASPSQYASPPPECHLVSQPLDQHPSTEPITRRRAFTSKNNTK
jgi:hypothetical protein